MKTSLEKANLAQYVARQVNTFFPDGRKCRKEDILEHLDSIMERVVFCFSKINNKYFFDGSDVIFNHLHADQYAMFLYFTANTLYRNNVDIRFCSKVFQLNRCLHGIDAFYEVELPRIFLFVHPLGTVLGRGQYSDYFMVYQRCGIGSNKDIYPVMKKFVTLRPGSSVLGNCVVEENCTIASDSLLLDRNLDKNSVYIGNPKTFFIREKRDTDSIWRI